MSVRELRRANDARLLTVVSALSADDWSRPSLCDRWSNHEVLAHLVVGLSASLRDMLGAMVCHRGSFDEANAEMARRLAAQRPPADLLDDFARLSRSPRGLGRCFPPRLLLGDHVTHELDIGSRAGPGADDQAGSVGGGARYPGACAQSVRACVRQLPRPAAAQHRRGLAPRCARPGGRRPRRRSGVGARQPAEGTATATRRRRRRTRGQAQVPDPYGRVMISR